MGPTQPNPTQPTQHATVFLSKGFPSLFFKPDPTNNTTSRLPRLKKRRTTREPKKNRTHLTQPNHNRSKATHTTRPFSSTPHQPPPLSQPLPVPCPRPRPLPHHAIPFHSFALT